MKRILLPLIWGLSLSASAQESLIVQPERVGVVFIGVHADELAREFYGRAELIDLGLEGRVTPALEIKLSAIQAGSSIVAELSHSDSGLVVSRISVIDPRLRTEEGVGVGSTYAELREQYHVDWVGNGESGVFARVEELGISFQLAAFDEGPYWRVQSREPDQVPEDARVVLMLLTRSIE